MDSKTKKQQFVLVTGPGGAGRSTAIHALEDLGYEAIDNMPLSLVPRLLDGPPLGDPLAVGIDARNRDFTVGGLRDMIDQLRLRAGPAIEVELLYLDARFDVLLRRYSETRRRHPLAANEGPEIGIAREADLLVGIQDQADILIDTSDLTPHDLRAEISRWFNLGGGPKLTVSVVSFSYKRGVPRSVDLLFDCRFLANPYWDAKLRAFDGRDPRVAAYVAADSRFAQFEARITDLCDFLLPAYAEEGKSHLSIGFGCTGGKHRSVAVAEKLGAALANSGWQVSIRHREQDRSPEAAPSRSAKTGANGA